MSDGRKPPRILSLDAKDGVTLVYRLWEAEVPRARVRIVHGLGEHGGRYTQLAEALVARGISCYAADLRGHGVSGGRRGHVDRFSDYLVDLEALRLKWDEGSVAVPDLLFGHSLGGLIVLRSLQASPDRGLRGAVLSAPSLELPEPGRRGRDAAAAVLSRMAPTLSLPNGIDPEHLSHDPAAVAAYRNDPLVHDRITPRLYAEMRRTMRHAAIDAPRVTVPVMLLAPGDDRIVETEGAVAVASRLSAPVSIRRYPGYYHEPLNEAAGASVLADVLAWIEEKLA